MATNYPSALDTTSNIIHNATDSTPTPTTHAAQHNNVADAIIAVETALGINPRGTYASVVAWLTDSVVKTPGAIQKITPSADAVALAVKQGNNIYVSNLFEARLSTDSIVAYIDHSGNFSAQTLNIAGTPLASTNLSDTANLARVTTTNNFTQVQTISASGGGKTTLAITSTGSNVGLTIGGDTAIYRSASGTLKTDGVFIAVGNLRAGGTSAPAYAVDATGDINASGIYRVGGTQISSANLSDSKSGTGALVLAAAPTLTGPVWANQVASGTVTLTNGSASYVLVDTTAAAFTITLPASPTTGSWFSFFDTTGKWATNNLTIGRNGKSINGSAANLVVSQNYADFTLTYDGTGWQTKNFSLRSPALTGTPTAPTAATNDNSTQIATTAYVQAQGYATAAYVQANTVRVLAKVTVPAVTVVNVTPVGLSFTIPANTLTANSGLRLRFFAHCDGISSSSGTVSLTLGGTTIKSTNVQSQSIDGQITMLQQNATSGANSQRWWYSTRNGSTAWWLVTTPLLSGLDMTVNQTITLQVSFSNVTQGAATLEFATLELLP